ncbi:helix-turn-helix transcriptional regulator [Desulfosporosinus sp.]|uniref:helix-turn-helix transcriptional regulator n=1 Tax=Desulfosporosinus sp. TaxID=157907 RepID=UPI00232480FD|nr:helix-turn-helix transcriptional regulator [Desulfosporosinus sp.]MCO5387458.1 helix-turn-helix transcriptional regulator [Desulfosporosinus sp.]MDA8220846.1 helix-turn-helix transcriptional regulator [Desulfitobacterium hafniense]
MNHDEVKKQLLQNSEVQKDYEDLKVLYDIKHEIIRLRLEQGLSQKELAEKINTKQSAISRLESGEYNPSIELLAKVANALGKELQISFQ